ncbi:MAG: hypothetical protein V1914_00035, partial [archaeon]
MNSKNPKILVGCPVSDRHEYCTEEFLKAIKEISYDNYDILLIDNSKDDRFFNSIKDKVPIIRGKSFPNVYERLIHGRNILRQKALDENYDYFFSLEQDVIPPKDIIDRLLAPKKDVITGVYFKPWEDGSDKEPVAMAWVKHPTLPDKMVPVRRDIIHGNSMVKIHFCGLGCVLIHRKVLEKVKFRYDLKKCKGTDDMFFCMDSREKGFDIYVDTSIKCRHMILGRPWCWEDMLSG